MTAIKSIYMECGHNNPAPRPSEWAFWRAIVLVLRVPPNQIDIALDMHIVVLGMRHMQLRIKDSICVCVWNNTELEVLCIM